MGVDAARPAISLAAVEAGGAAPAWNRFAHWPQAPARLLLAVVMAMILASAWVPITVGRGDVATPPPLGQVFGAEQATPRPRDADLKLYDAAIARIRRGENYYRFIAAEHRQAHYPLRPAVAVRLPTLAYLDAWAGPIGQTLAAVALMLGVLWAWWQRLGEEPGGRRHRNFAVALLFSGAALGLNRYYFALHELWAGMLMALSFGLHRSASGPPLPPSPSGEGPGVGTLPKRRARTIAPTPTPPLKGRGLPGHWLGAWGAAALALAIREHTLPFVLLMAGFAGWRRQWREAAAWTVLVGLFAIGLGWHLQLIAAQALPSDPIGPSWLALRGLGGWLSDIALSSNLRFLPHWLAGPLVMLMILGWAGWRSAAGSFATVLYLGYGAAFMIAGRADNFYWGVMIAPTMFIGLAFAPMAISALVASWCSSHDRRPALINARTAPPHRDTTG